jgi:hypothetical protein
LPFALGDFDGVSLAPAEEPGVAPASKFDKLWIEIRLVITSPMN